jgi:hypothetical protein
MLDYGPHNLTPDEMADLAIVGARARIDGGDIRPVCAVYRDGSSHVIPWEQLVVAEVGRLLTGDFSQLD